VRGVVLVLLYLVVLPFRWSVYLVTCLRVAVGGFVLELPRLGYLVLLVFERVALVYLVFAVFDPSVLVLGFHACISLAVFVFECGLSCGRWWVVSYLVSALLNPLLLFCALLLSFCLPFSRFLSLLRSPLLFLCSPVSSLLYPLSVLLGLVV
jgi:hypothetical protein